MAQDQALSTALPERFGLPQCQNRKNRYNIHVSKRSFVPCSSCPRCSFTLSPLNSSTRAPQRTLPFLCIKFQFHSNIYNWRIKNESSNWPCFYQLVARSRFHHWRVTGMKTFGQHKERESPSRQELKLSHPQWRLYIQFSTNWPDMPLYGLV